MEKAGRYSMVTTLALNQTEPEIRSVELPKDDVKWCTVSLDDILKANIRLEASVFDIKGKHAREILKECKWKVVAFEKLLTSAYYPGRFKRIYTDAINGVSFFLPSQMTDIHPRPDKYISSLTKCDISELRLKKGDILLTRSGTIGAVTLVSKTLENTVFSDDVIRITSKETTDASFLYAYLKSDIGNTILQTNGYGSVIIHIEPEHLAGMPVPNPPDGIKKRIHDLIIRSFDMRDESNKLIDKATKLLIDELQLPPLHKLKIRRFNNKVEVDNYNVKLSNLNGRLDGSFHVPIVNAITEHLRKFADELIMAGDERASKEIILPGRFKRVYVEEGQGRVFFSGRSIMELDPSDKKYLSFVKHNKRIKDQLTIKHNMILVTCSGTIGKVALVPKHWDNWAMTHDIIRIIPDITLTGYLYIWLQTEYANKLIQAMSYGSVVPHIEIEHIKKIPVPVLKNKSIQDKINALALEANKMRYEAYILEQKAMNIMNDEVIYARN
jgi:type I restriction enzyme S subunit